MRRYVRRRTEPIHNCFIFELAPHAAVKTLQMCSAIQMQQIEIKGSTKQQFLPFLLYFLQTLSTAGEMLNLTVYHDSPI